MKNTCLLSEDTKTYLCCYHQVLDEMIQAMTTAGLTRSVSHNFIVQMAPHHRAAVKMSNNILRFTNNQPMRRFAQHIINEHTQCVEQMEAALDACKQLTNSPMDLRLYQRRMDLIFREMYFRMGCVPESNRIEAGFLHGMLPHYLGALRMAENALKYDISTELVPILRSITALKRREIAQMRALLNHLRCQPR